MHVCQHDVDVTVTFFILIISELSTCVYLLGGFAVFLFSLLYEHVNISAKEPFTTEAI